MRHTRLVHGGIPYGSARSEPPEARPTWVEVDLDAIAANVATLKAQAASPQLMAVVKADGYGHGLVPAARAALAGGADWLAVALVEEGEALRRAGVGEPILVMAEVPLPALARILDAALTPTVYTAAFGEALDDEAARRGVRLDVHLKLDTGMRRLGVPEADWVDAFSRLARARALRVQGIWSHLAVAEDPADSFTAGQGEALRRGVEQARAHGLVPGIVHLCNSAGTLLHHDLHLDAVRPGIAIYGLDPAPGVAHGVPLRPALSWYARLSLVKRLAAGEAVSYGLRWRAERDTVVGTVPAGYADGVVRALSCRGEVVVRGRRRPIAGTVCMDQFLVDLDDEQAVVGDEVCLIGAQNGVAVTAGDWSGWLDTINYEIVCGIGKRVPRVYLGGA